MANVRWELNLNRGLDRLPTEEKYRCVAGIPGPALEMRSGALPSSVARGTGVKDFTRMMARVTGLDSKRLKDSARDIAREYSSRRILKQLRAVSADRRTKLTLMRGFMSGLVHRARGRSNTNVSPKTREVRLTPCDQTVRIAYPGELVSLGLLWEVFVEKTYHITEPVPRIFDFGANIGLSTVYFHLINSSAEFVCVEPLETNFKLLERNVRENDVPAELICAAVGDRERKVPLYSGDQSHALPSLQTKQSESREVQMLPVDSIVSGSGYGLKIDIEGAESSLVDFPSVIENAAWIAGELHYDGDEEHDAKVDEYFDIVTRTFDVEKGRPVAYFIGDDVVICECFKATKRK